MDEIVVRVRDELTLIEKHGIPKDNDNWRDKWFLRRIMGHDVRISSRTEPAKNVNKPVDLVIWVKFG